ncbi:hypothetical protein NPIL_153571 [Nephila pilipes]|uniref:Uncharacterized protein n=1 Tax=Nephila pilipes TaxID=299642 RepID=A0A8X6N9F4_NEPPI|nr:hypothetical protein NPIL_153571 [Nephila pilipes]
MWDCPKQINAVGVLKTCGQFQDPVQGIQDLLFNDPLEPTVQSSVPGCASRRVSSLYPRPNWPCRLLHVPFAAGQAVRLLNPLVPKTSLGNMGLNWFNAAPTSQSSPRWCLWNDGGWVPTSEGLLFTIAETCRKVQVIW